ncbi:hypothetical protein OBBRIDRAFT_725550 [Obba rivulosa]|uniref:Telomerase reverse transcriptase C-terminal extension domain-containing protein n=1 Tax=Obba rivulosa TaxID=1052685 RepID=A0A8E2DMN7_9APHY|nr:hypothetical protein OBBRIDRAFT_725550 [Obba rivulosa]
MKMHHYLGTRGLTIRENAPFILNAIRQYLRETFVAMKSKALSKTARANGGRCDVQASELTWLGTHAFHVVLSRKSSVYTKLLKSLELQLATPRQRLFKQRFRGVIREGLGMVVMLDF